METIKKYFENVAAVIFFYSATILVLSFTEFKEIKFFEFLSWINPLFVILGISISSVSASYYVGEDIIQRIGYIVKKIIAFEGEDILGSNNKTYRNNSWFLLVGFFSLAVIYKSANIFDKYFCFGFILLIIVLFVLLLLSDFKIFKVINKIFKKFKFKSKNKKSWYLNAEINN